MKYSIKKVTCAVTAVLYGLALSTNTLAAEKMTIKFEPVIGESEQQLPVRYIIKYKKTAANTMMKATGKRGFNPQVAKQALLHRGAKIELEISAQHSIAALLKQSDVNSLRNDPSVEYVEVDSPRKFMALYNDDAGDPITTQLTPYAIYQSQANQLSLQPGMKVCVIDSGIAGSDGETGGINNDFVWANITGTNDSGTGDWNADGGPHGTHVAGTVAAANNDFGVIGMAPGVALHIVKVFNAAGWGYSSDLAQAASVCTDAGANIITMSLGGGAANSTEENAFNTFTNNGGLVLAAAGNDGNTTRSYPAGYDSVMMIGANDGDNNIASFSQYPSCNAAKTDCVEVTAGGVNTLSTYPSDGGTLSSLSADDIGFASAAMGNIGSASASAYFMGTAETTDAAASGKVCMIDRGNISFHDKVKNCEDSGGIGAVIVNNVDGVLQGTLGDTNTTTIPAVGADLADRSALIGASTASISVGASDYGYMSGTSMATPGVAGVAALVWSNHQTCTGTEIRNTLKATAEDSGSTGHDVYFGNGIVKAKMASDWITTNGCSGSSADEIVLDNGVAKLDLSAAKDEQISFTMDVPAGATDLSFVITGGSGDADLYVKFGSEATTSSYDCRPYKSGNEETCTITNIQTGTYYVMLDAYSAFSGVSLTGSYTEGSTGGSASLSNLEGSKDSWAHYTLEIPAGMSTLSIVMSGGSGDADLYVREGAQPTLSTYDCRPYKNGNDETCSFSNPAASTWYISIYGYSAYTGVSLDAAWNP